MAARRLTDVEASVKDAIDVCREALKLFDAPQKLVPSPKADEANFVRQQIADIAFVGMAELRGKLAQVTALASALRRAAPAQDPGLASIAEACESSLRGVEKSLIALHLAVAYAAGRPGQLTFGSLLAHSLEVREQYTRLRHAILACTTPTDAASLRRVLQTSQVALMLVTGRELFQTLRFADRRRLRELEGRIDAWCLRGRAQKDGEEEGRRLWQDLVGFAGLLAGVSHRQELVEHDTIAVESLRTALAASGGPLTSEARRLGQSLIGLDDEIDRLLAQENWTHAAWLPIVRRLHRKLTAPETGRFALGGGAGARREG